MHAKTLRLISPFVCLMISTFGVSAAFAESHKVVDRQWRVGGQERTGFVAVPKKPSGQCPVLIVYHGHGGTAKKMVQKDFHSHWPEAVVVYPQGLPTASGRDPEGKLSGWQNRLGSNQDRDLKFFDTLLEKLREKFQVDNRRIFVTGHSNGGGMTALLWATRHDQLAGVAISAGGIGEASKLKPLPVFHLAGRQDSIVPFANQQRSIEWFKIVNATNKDKKSLPGIGTLNSSPLGTDVVVHIHDGGHKILPDAPQRIVRFFKMLQRPRKGYPGNPKLFAANVKREHAFMKSRFQSADKNADGKVTSAELGMPRVFERLDRNQDGFVTLDEVRSKRTQSDRKPSSMEDGSKPQEKR